MGKAAGKTQLRLFDGQRGGDSKQPARSSHALRASRAKPSAGGGECTPLSHVTALMLFFVDLSIHHINFL